MAEIKGERPATGVVVPALNLRRIRIMLGTSQPAMSRQFREVVEQADEDGLLDGQELGRILDTDIVIRGARRDTGVRVYVPIEVTFKIDRDDIQRAEKSTEILGRLFPSDDVIGAVFGGEISEQDRAYAESRGIRVFLD